MEQFELDDEERALILEKRRKIKNSEKVGRVSGIGLGMIFQHAKLDGKKFIDEATYIEEEGDPRK